MTSPMPSSGATPARSTDDLPLPEAPTTARNGCRRSRSTMSATTSSRPKKRSASVGGEREEAGVRALGRRRRGVHAGRGDGEHLLGLAHAAQAGAARGRPGRRRRGGGRSTSPAVTLREQDLPGVGQAAEAGGHVQRGAHVVAAAPVGLARCGCRRGRRAGGRRATWCVARPLTMSMAALTAAPGAGYTVTVESPSPCASRNRPPCRSAAAATRSSCTRERP